MTALIRTKDMHHLDIRKLRLDGRMLGRMVRIGFPSGLQSVMYGLSNVIIQSGINSLGTDSVAAWASYSKIDSLFWMMINAFGIAVTTFVGQNYGAGKTERVRAGIRTCMGMAFAASIGMSALIYYWGIYGFELFTTDAEVIRIGTAMIHYLSRFYVLYVTIEILSGAMRAVGDSWAPMLLCLFGVCALRVSWILFVVPLNRNMYMIMFSYPLTWVVTTILFVVYYLFFSRLRIRKPDLKNRV
jgi:Na+-driven multidrug efflux pump